MKFAGKFLPSLASLQSGQAEIVDQANDSPVRRQLTPTQGS